MKHLILATLAASAVGVAEARADYALTILHTNDFHSRVLASDRWGNPCTAADDAAGKCLGGSARLMTAVADARRRSQNTLLLSAGDQFPNPSYGGEFSPSLAAELMNRIGYDAMTLGNADFQDGIDVLADFIDHLDFPVLVANSDFSGDARMAEKTRSSVVIERGGELVGVVGAILEFSRASRAYGIEIDTTPAAVAVQADVDRLTQQGVDKIIVVSHLGYRADARLAEATTGIDVVVGGHTHTYLSSEDPRAEGPYPSVFNGVLVVQTVGAVAELGELTVTFDEKGHVTHAAGAPVRLDGSVDEDPGIRTLIAERWPGLR